MADYSRKDREGFIYELERHLGVLSERTIQGEPYALEVNLIRWNNKAPKIDIRSWDKKTHKIMTKGVTLTEAEAKKFTEIISAL